MDKISNEDINRKLDVELTSNNVAEYRQNWAEHFSRMRDPCQGTIPEKKKENDQRDCARICEAGSGVNAKTMECKRRTYLVWDFLII